MEQINLETLNKNVVYLTQIVESMKAEIEDRFLTAEEELKLEKSLEEFEKGETFSLEDIEKARNEN